MQKKCSTVTFKRNCSYIDVATKISEKVTNSWIYIHNKLLNKLIKDNDSYLYVIDKKIEMFLLWQPTEKIDYISLKLKQTEDTDELILKDWKKVVILNDINSPYDNPKEILFFKLEE